MLVSFIGCPSSGKTTTAAMTFARLKDMNFTTEFIVEAARKYIIHKRLEDGLSPGTHPVLTDGDQIHIMAEQFGLEEEYIWSCGPEMTIITDSSPLNALLYMGAKTRASTQVQDIRKKVLERDTLYFYCPPIPPGDREDQNRVHSYEESLKVDESIGIILADVSLIPLFGGTEERVVKVFDKVLTHILAKLRPDDA